MSPPPSRPSRTRETTYSGYSEARGWTVTEYVDEGVSGAKESRPALDRLLKDARRRRLDALVVWRLDRLGRNLRHLILTLDELTALGVSFVSLGEGIDTGTPAGRLQRHILGAIAEFERARIAERVKAGVERARRQGRRLGRPEREVPDSVLAPVRGLSVRETAKRLGVSTATASPMAATNPSTESDQAHPDLGAPNRGVGRRCGVGNRALSVSALPLL